MAVQDIDIGWNRKRRFFPVTNMLGVISGASLGAGTTTLAEVAAALELGGLPFDDEDEVYHILPIPWDLDRGHPIRFRPWFVHTTTDADTPDWAVYYKFFGKQDAVSDIAANTEETLSILNHAVSTTDNSLEITAWAESNSQNYIAATDFALGFALELTDLGSASADEIILLGMEIDYVLGAAPNIRRLLTLDGEATHTHVDGRDGVM
jgi:hypothetical protein